MLTQIVQVRVLKKLRFLIFDSVSQTSIKNCWNKANIIKEIQIIPDKILNEESINIENSLELSYLIAKTVPENYLNPEEYFALDNDSEEFLDYPMIADQIILESNLSEKENLKKIVHQMKFLFL